MRYLLSQRKKLQYMVALFLLPAITSAQGLVPCTDNCGFNDLVTLIQNIIRFIFTLVIPLAAIMLVITGIIYITSGGNPARRGQAKKYFINFFYGLITIMLAWIIVATIFTFLGVPDAYVLLAI